MRNFFFVWATAFLPGLILWLWEKADPLQGITYSQEAVKELKYAAINTAYMVIFVYVYPVYSSFAQLLIPPSLLQTIGWNQLLMAPLFLRIVIAIVVIEVSLYLLHWQTHNNQFFWRIHKWHHSIETVWWLSGMRTTLIGRFLFGTPILLFPALAIPAPVPIAYAIITGIHNVITHLNIKWRPWMKTVEWILVTPRYHYVHHFAEPQFQGKNLAGKFTILDRIFGTYLDPDLVDYKQEEFGLGGEPVTVKMTVGI